MEERITAATPLPAWREYLGLCKPRIVALIVFTAVVGMLLAVPAQAPVETFLLAALGIGLAAASGAVFNQVLDRDIDAVMARTRRRPLPSGQVETGPAIVLGVVLCVGSAGLLLVFTNWLTAALTLLSLVGYAVVYTVYLKPATPQNIVIGGAAGAMPPVLGWLAVTGQIDPHALLLFLIIFAWTPPHFWALALHRREEYARAEVPMLPVTHGEQFTKLHILLYTIILLVVSLLPFVMRMSGVLYLGGAVLLGGGFLYYAIALHARSGSGLAMRTFRYSISYLAGLFLLLLVDHYVQVLFYARA